MQDKIDYLKERIDNISSIIGEEIIDTKTKGNKSQENKNKTISDTISFIKLQMNDNTNISSDTIKKSK